MGCSRRAPGVRGRVRVRVRVRGRGRVLLPLHRLPGRARLLAQVTLRDLGLEQVWLGVGLGVGVRVGVGVGVRVRG